jgi:thiol-disulfide isomerase/thioredoxin
MRVAILLGLGLILLGAIWLRGHQTEAPPDPAAPMVGVAVGESAPPFSLPQWEGATLNLQDYRGRVVILNFWATWCTPCKAEMPLLEDIAQRYGNQVVVIAVNYGDDPGYMGPFLEKMQLSYPIVLDRDLVVARQYQVVALPTTYILDAEGRIQAKVFGPLTGEWVIEKLQTLLDQP